MKKYIAIGHWDGNEDTTSTSCMEDTKSKFMETLKLNGFRVYVVLTEKAFDEMKEMDCFDLYEKVKKLSSNYRKYNEITDYIEQCMDIMSDKLAKAQ